MRMGKTALLCGVAMLAMATAAEAQTQTMSNAELAARLQALEDELSAQQDRAMCDRTRLSTLEQGYNSAVWNFDNGRATFASGDGRFTMAIRARMQADFAGFIAGLDPSRRLRRSFRSLERRRDAPRLFRHRRQGL